MTAPRVLVVGAGAAGLTAAMRAGEAGARVTLLNAHPKIGLKILMSGGTRCNVTHREVTERDFCGGSRNVIARILRAFTPAQTLEWFASFGVSLKLEDTGKYFPDSDDAQTVLDALLRGVRDAGVEVVTGERVVRLEPNGPAWRAGVQRIGTSAMLGAEASAVGSIAWPLPDVTPDAWRPCDRVILATGGLSFPRTGSDGTGYALATALGHSLVPPVPALTPLVSSDALLKAVQGVTLDAALTLHADGKRAETTTGSLLITHFGYSGPAALDLSRHWWRAEGSARRVTANFAPGATRETLAAEWIAAAAAEPARTVRRHLAARMPERLAVELCWETEIDPARALSQTSRARRDALLSRVVERDLGVTGTLGYEKAEVTAGGVPLSEVDPSTLESRLAPGLFLCGEMLDVEGRLGGFNFQWSWSSGTVAGRSAGRLVS